jgi:hypothetical protein
MSVAEFSSRNWSVKLSLTIVSISSVVVVMGADRALHWLYLCPIILL